MYIFAGTNLIKNIVPRKTNLDKKAREFVKMPKEKIGSNYLKNLKFIVRENRYDKEVTYSQLLFLLFVYDYDFFTADIVAQHMSENRKAVRDEIIYPLVRSGHLFKKFDRLTVPKTPEGEMFTKYEDRYAYKVRYAISQKGRLYVQRIYRKMEGKETIYLDERKI